MSTLPTRRRQQGVTLIESLIAVLLLSVGALALMRVQPELRQHAEFARQRSEAVRLAQEEIEAARGIATAAGFAALVDRAITLEPDGLGRPRFALQRRVDALAWPGTKVVTVQVSWVDRQGEAQQLSLHTLLAAADATLSGASLLPR